MPKKPQPIESFARSLEAISLAIEKCANSESSKCIVSALKSAEKNLTEGLITYKEQQSRDAEFFAEVSSFTMLRSVDFEKAEEVLKKIDE